MLLSKISLRGSGVKSMTVADQSSRAWGFECIPGKSSDLVPVLEQTRRVAPADSKVFTDRPFRFGQLGRPRGNEATFT
jgi:hypothetical protein